MQRKVITFMDKFHFDMTEINALISDGWHIVSCRPINKDSLEYLLEDEVLPWEAVNAPEI